MDSASNTVRVDGYYAEVARLADQSVEIAISNIINPFRATTTAFFEYFIRKPDDSIIDQSPNVLSGIGQDLTFNPGTFTSCAISAGGATVSTRAAFQFTLLPKHLIPSDGQLVIEVPLKWNGDISSTNSVASNPACSNIANLAGSISCTFVTQSSINIARITVSSLSSTTLDNSQSFSFLVNSILTPPFQGST